MSYLLRECGFQRVQEIKKAAIVIINTCIVKAPTEDKIKNLLKKLHKNHLLIVAGCLPQVMDEWCQEFIPKASLIGVDHFKDICQVANEHLKGKKVILLSRKQSFQEIIHKSRQNPLTGIIEISKGCTGNCAYCIVKFAKGPLISKPPEMIMKETHQALADGCKQLWLTAQDTASYGKDIGTNLPELLTQIIQIPRDFIIRIGMMTVDHALTIEKELIEILAHPKVYAFAHLPVQSASNRILKKMNRQYSIEEFLHLISTLRERIPNITLSTDVIVGFPTETQKDHNKTITLLTEKNFDIVNISKYGDRPGTEASFSKQKIPSQIIKKRSKEITKVVHKKTLERNRNWIDWEGAALALKEDPFQDGYLLRNRFYKIVGTKSRNIKLGNWYSVKITGATKTRLHGQILNKLK